MGVTDTAESSVVRFIDGHPTKPHLEGGNYYVDKLIVFNCLYIAVMLNLNTLTDNAMGSGCAFVSLNIAQTKPETRITCVTYSALILFGS